ncbi:MAG: lysophospholipid acyltransferase family protein [Gammaproteobacteria bacterium]
MSPEHWPKILFFALLVRPFVTLVLGLNLRGHEHLRAMRSGIVVANHNSHLDTLVLMSLFPLRRLPRIHPMAAADYFFRNPALKWIATRLIGILPVDRGGYGRATLRSARDALRRGDILILFPEGTRGKPEQLSTLKKGVAHIAALQPESPVLPIHIHGLGRALPRGEALLVPMICDIAVQQPRRMLDFSGKDRDALMDWLQTSLSGASGNGHSR